MIKILKKSYITVFLLTVFFNLQLFSQSYNIDYYGIVCKEIDSNMSKMTSDLYYTQLSEINNFSTTDQRTENSMTENPDISRLSQSKLSFYTEITKNTNDDTWTVTFHVVDRNAESEQTSTKIYDSFYKILMEPKSTLQSSIKTLIESNHKADANSITSNSIETDSGALNTETLSGTWAGEPFIDKVVILRGGRGFVIFNNGASMNISVELTNTNKGKQVIVTQKGRSNASFFPDLPRNIALNAALSAQPITWKFSIIDTNTLSGLKTTLVASTDNFDYEDIKVTWNRIN